MRANGFGGGLDLSQVPLADVERIEVVRGPQSALYGADAIGGVIHVITRAGGAAAHGLHGDGQPRHAARHRVTTGSRGGFRWQAGGDYFTDGFTGTAASGEPVTNDDARIAQGSLVVGWQARRGPTSRPPSATPTPTAARPARSAATRQDASRGSSGPRAT